MDQSRKMFYGATPQIFGNAAKLRKEKTPEEKLLWEELKANKLLGLRFKAQHPIGNFIADFYCHKIKLVIELDGQWHETTEQKSYDDGRTFEMEELGITVIRFSNSEIRNEMSKVLTSIKEICIKLLSTNSNHPDLKGMDGSTNDKA